MEKREDALREALLENSSETERWNAYKKENETAIENLDRFAKHLSVEVMVPIGGKAFVPGELIHTNEVLVGHFQGYFSKCSAHKAEEICRLRLNMAQKHLIKLEKEAEMWQNKLEKPYADGVLPTADQQDILEFVSEEEHTNWLEKHKLMVKKHKEQKKKKREKKEKDTSEMDEAALLEELEEDFGQLKVGELNNEELTKLLSGDKTVFNDPILLPGTNENKSQEVNKPKSDDIMKMLEEMERMEDEKHELENVETDSNANDMVHRMMAGSLLVPDNKNRKSLVNKEYEDGEKVHNKNCTPESLKNHKFLQNVEGKESSENLEEINTIREEAKYLALEDRVSFYEFQIQIMQEKSRKLDRNKSNYNQEKLRLMDITVSLTEDLETLQDQIDLLNDIDEEILEDNVAKCEEEETAINDGQKKKNRRISFALSEETLEFRKNETVAEMLPKHHEPKQPVTSGRDIIVLDDTVISKDVIPAEETSVNLAELRKQTILNKVAQNLEYVAENQSVHDVDLVNKILNASDNRSKTLYIKFKHSNAERCENVDDGEIPSTPRDFYAQYIKNKNAETLRESVFVNGYNNEDQVKSPLLSETKRDQAFEDLRTAFSTPGALENGSMTLKSGIQTKSILLNKSAVDREVHLDNVKPKNKFTKQKKMQRGVDDPFDQMSAYNKVMKEVTERQTTTSEPDPLPKCQYIDSNTPKKRISRFKQQRSSSAN